jgi:hypothetical protein
MRRLAPAELGGAQRPLASSRASGSVKAAVGRLRGGHDLGPAQVAAQQLQVVHHHVQRRQVLGRRSVEQRFDLLARFARRDAQIGQTRLHLRRRLVAELDVAAQLARLHPGLVEVAFDGAVHGELVQRAAGHLQTAGLQRDAVRQPGRGGHRPGSARRRGRGRGSRCLLRGQGAPGVHVDVVQVDLRQHAGGRQGLRAGDGGADAQRATNDCRLGRVQLAHVLGRRHVAQAHVDGLGAAAACFLRLAQCQAKGTRRFGRLAQRRWKIHAQAFEAALELEVGHAALQLQAGRVAAAALQPASQAVEFRLALHRAKAFGREAALGLERQRLVAEAALALDADGATRQLGLDACQREAAFGELQRALDLREGWRMRHQSHVVAGQHDAGLDLCLVHVRKRHVHVETVVGIAARLDARDEAVGVAGERCALA